MTSPLTPFENIAYFTTRDNKGGQYGTLVSRAEMGDSQAYVASRHTPEGFDLSPNTGGSMAIHRTQEYGYNLLLATSPETTKNDPMAAKRILAMLAFAAFHDEVEHVYNPHSIAIDIVAPDRDEMLDTYRHVLGARRIRRIGEDVDNPHDIIRTTLRRSVGRSALVLHDTQSYVSPFPAAISM